MYQLYQQNYRYSEIKKYYPIEKGKFYYLMRILNRYGISWLYRPRHKWTKEEKMEAIDRVLINHETRRSVAIDLGLSSDGMLSNWILDYQKNSYYNVIDKPIGRPRKKSSQNVITKRKIRLKQKIRESKKPKNELLYLKTEKAYLKGLRELTLQKKKNSK